MAESSPLPSCCFICGDKICNNEEKSGNGTVKRERLNKLLKCLNDLLIAASGRGKGESVFYKKRKRQRATWAWATGTGLPEEIANCCGSCYGLLNGIENTHRFILASQNRLREDLVRVRKLVVKSETEEKEASLWDPKCLEIRTRILGKAPGCGIQKMKINDDAVVKEEPASEDCAEEDSQDYLDCKSGEANTEAGLPVEDDFSQETDSRDDTDSVPLAKKPKMEEEDKPKEMETDADSDPEDDDGNLELESESDADTSRESDRDQQPSQKVRHRSPQRPGIGKHFCRPLIIAKPDLFLYRGSHYFQKTPTHLQCLAHECSFQTDFDYYSSFQLIKKHIDDTHFGKSPLFCLLCEGNRFFPYKDELRSHNKSFHLNIFNRKGRAICECCLKSVPHVKLREHMLLHKSQEEIATALELRKQSFQQIPNLPESPDNPSNSTTENSGRHLTKFHALVITREDLYLYRWRTYIQKTPTHLKCLSFQCTFQTQFDYYSSFQLIKKHIEDVHRTRYQLNRMPVVCRLCENSPVFTSHDLLVDHHRMIHKLGSESKKMRAVCECCLKGLSVQSVPNHMFFHKNDAEKAAALASGQGPRRHLYAKEYFQNAEKKHKCDFPNCTMAFHGLKQLERHKQSHLPKEQRTDQTLCPECGIYVFTGNFSYHVEKTHYSETMTNCVTCPFCSKKFDSKRKYLYEAHLRGHRGERPFLCEDCGASFTYAGKLSAHVKMFTGRRAIILVNFAGKFLLKNLVCGTTGKMFMGRKRN